METLMVMKKKIVKLGGRLNFCILSQKYCISQRNYAFANKTFAFSHKSIAFI